MNRLVTVLFVGLVLLASTACSSKLPPPKGLQEPVKLEAIRGYNPDPQVVEIEVNRQEYIDAVREPGMLSNIRLIRVFSHQSTTVGDAPEYRVFDIQPGSPYWLLGLRVGDVLVAVEGWVLIDPERFAPYVKMLQVENGTELEVRREDHPLLLRVTLVPPV